MMNYLNGGIPECFLVPATARQSVLSSRRSSLLTPPSHTSLTTLAWLARCGQLKLLSARTRIPISI